jgi:hypothetical protein
LCGAASDADFVTLRNEGMSEACEFTILMPCLNEAETLASCISKARAFLARSGCPGEVVIADNGSTDGSQAIAAANGARVVEVTERGYGSALLGGIRAARHAGAPPLFGQSHADRHRPPTLTDLSEATSSVNANNRSRHEHCNPYSQQNARGFSFDNQPANVYYEYPGHRRDDPCD